MSVAASRLTAWCASALVVAGCTASSDEVHPHPDELFFPSGLAVSPDSETLFVANANSELRFDSGSISVLPLDTVQSVIDAWKTSQTIPGAPFSCEADADNPRALRCEESAFMNPDAGVRIGNFATDLAVQAFPSGAVRVFAPTRGDPSVAWADYDKDSGALSCGPSEPFGLCDDAHRLSQIQNDPDLEPIPSEPFGVFADGPNGFVAISHLSIGGISLIASGDPDPGLGPDGRPKEPPGPVRVVDVRAGFFLPDGNTGVAATAGITGRRPGTKPGVDGPGDIIYAGSPSDARVQTFTVGTLPLDPPDPEEDPPKHDDRPTEASYLIPGNYILLGGVGAGTGGSSETRGMQFSADGNQLYMVQRRPPSLQVYDTSLGPTGAPQNLAAGGIDICRQASTLAVVGTALGTRVYVTCFQDGEIYVVDPNNLGQLDDILLVGRGPYSVAASEARKQLYVSNFLEDTIAVVDVDPTSTTYNRVVLRIGKPKALPQ